MSIFDVEMCSVYLESVVFFFFLSSSLFCSLLFTWHGVRGWYEWHDIMLFVG